ncbi:MAG: carboxypeptidase-like regulatory domain-containing protein [Planctomycetota bacterium]
MKIQVAQRFLAAIACVGMMVPQSAFAAAPASAGAADVALRSGGVFVGKVVDAQGIPMATEAVSLQQAGREVARTTTDASGAFAAQGLRAGEYQVVAGGGVASFRLWAPETAPPAANTEALIVTGDAIVNGMHQGGILGWAQEHPLLVTAAIATAIAVPIAVADDDDDSTP